MIPLFLSIEGMYSYQDKQVIDFQKLTSVGLFGIFGKVGSGKSTIVEAMVMALYGKLERLSRHNLGYNMMNLKSSKMEVEFHCVAKDQKTYIFQVKSRRNSKNFSKILNLERMVYVLENEEKIPMPSADGEAILGMSYENFKRTVMIQQGMFREFLELKSTDRTEMLKQLFQLEAYDLSEKTKILKTKTEAEKLNLEGKLTVFSEISPETVEEKYKIWQQAVVNLNQKQKIFEQTAELFKKVEEFQNIQLQMQLKESALRELLEKQLYFDELGVKLNQFKVVKSEFDLIVHQYEEFTKEISALSLKKKNSANQILENSAQLAQLKTQFAQNQIEFEQLDQQRIVLNDLEIGIELIDFQQKESATKLRIEKGQFEIDKIQTQIHQLLEQKKQFELEISAKQSQKVDAELLQKLSTWWQEYEHIQQQLDLVSAQKIDFEKVIQESEHIIIQHGFALQDWQSQCEAQILQLETLLKTLQLQENEWLVQEKMSNFVNNLETGHACPLCGSLEHPHPAQAHIDHQLLSNIHSEKESLSAQIHALNSKKTAMWKAQSVMDMNKQHLNKLNEKILVLHSEKQEKSKLFHFEGFTIDGKQLFQEKFQQNVALEKEIVALRNQLSTCDVEVEKNRLKKEEYQSLFSKIQEEYQKYINAKENAISRLKKMRVVEISALQITEIQERIAQLQKDMRRVESNHSRLQSELSQAETRLAVTQSELQQYEAQYYIWNDKFAVNEQVLKTKLADFKIDMLQEVQEILKQNLNISALENQLSAYLTDKKSLELQLKELQSKWKALGLNAEQTVQITERFHQESMALELLKKAENTAQIDYKNDAEKLTEKQKIAQHYDEISLRSKNLHELSLLFTAKGFVNYISTQYLMDLCEIANQRFYKLTKQKLSLKIDDKNEFVVIDHNHFDKERSVHTLSGGQFFQASLSLALALADSTRALNQNEKSFFFIDEGFGTQDEESMEQIFETLTALHEENRMVGIISHVESLKERIPIALDITHQAENGSKVQFIFN